LSGPAQEDTDFKISFFAPGIQWDSHRPFDYGIGVQYRFERLKFDDGESASNNRAWLNLHGGYTFRQVQTVKPFLALRLSAALSKTNPPGQLASNDDVKTLAKYLEGDREVSLQLGVRF